MADVVLRPTLAYRTPMGQVSSVRQQLARLVLGKSYKDCTEKDLDPAMVTEKARGIRSLTLVWPECMIDEVVMHRALSSAIAALVKCHVSNFFFSASRE